MRSSMVQLTVWVSLPNRASRNQNRKIEDCILNIQSKIINLKDSILYLNLNIKYQMRTGTAHDLTHSDYT